MQQRPDSKTGKGFTLIEMSIVLVIIGLITGSVFVGKTLIRQSQINSAMADEQHYIQAALAFQQKYGALPGDFAGATALWGYAGGSGTGNDAGCFGATGTAPATCNGNGDGQIFNASNTTAQNYNEPLRFWQHLVNAQLIQGSYSGVAGDGNFEHDVGTNCPESKVSGGGFGITYAGIVNSATSTGDYTDYPNGTYGHVFLFGAQATGLLPVGALLTTAEASGVDTKFDDGVPTTGNIATWNAGDATTGYAGSCVSSGAYATTVLGPQCSLIMLTGF